MRGLGAFAFVHVVPGLGLVRKFRRSSQWVGASHGQNMHLHSIDSEALEESSYRMYLTGT